MNIHHSLPILIIFERPWDEMPKKLVKNLLTELSTEGYNTLCMEYPQDIPKDQILLIQQEGLKNVQKIYSHVNRQVNSSDPKIGELSEMCFNSLSALIKEHSTIKEFYDCAEVIKQLPAALILSQVLNEAKSLSFDLKGIDINSQDFNQIFEPDITKRGNLANSFVAQRIETITNNLFKLYEEQKRIIYTCSASLAANLITNLKEKKLLDHIAYYFPHSTKRYEEGSDDLELFANEGLTDCMRSLSTENDIKLLSNEILGKVKSWNYQEEIFNDRLGCE